MANENRYMQLAIELAQQGKGLVSPNPLVGAVIVRNGEIVGKGYHPYFGGEHAEIVALKKAGSKAKEAVLFCNLEPCVHFGKRPPCVPEIVKAGIKKAVIAIQDPNPINAGRGIKALKKAGIEVSLGMEAEKAQELNKKFAALFKKKIKCLQE